MSLSYAILPKHQRKKVLNIFIISAEFFFFALFYNLKCGISESAMPTWMTNT